MLDWKRALALKEAWFGAVLFTSINTSAHAVLLIGAPFPPSSAVTLLRDLQVVWNISLLALLWRRRHALTPTASRSILVLALLPLLALFWARAQAAETMALEWEPLLREKFLFFIVALLAPGPAWFGSILLVAVVGEATAEYCCGGIRPDQLFGHEPWVTFTLAALAEFVILARALGRAQRNALIRRLTELSHQRRMAEMTLAVRDLANSPLQILAIQIPLLARTVEAAAPFIPPMTRAYDRLTALNAQLRKHEVASNGTQQLAFDAAAVLARPTRGERAARKG